MTTPVVGEDFLQEYKAISAKIRKRFLRKPNIAEASEDYSKLSLKQKEYESWPQVGLCCMAIAKCEQFLANPTTEVAAVLEAARSFLKEHTLSHRLQCPQYNEHLISAISFYQQAIKIYVDQSRVLMAASLGMEIGMSLCALTQPSEGLTFLQEAEERLQGSPLEQLTCLDQIAAAYIDLGNLDGSLKVFSKMTTLAKEIDEVDGSIVIKDILTRCEVCSILLLLTLKILPNQLSADQSMLIEKYSWSDSQDDAPADVPYDDTELRMFLQSLVISCQSRDLDSLKKVEVHLTKRLSGQALHLLYVLVTEMNRE